MTENGPPGSQGPPQITRPTENKTRIPRPMLCKILLLNGEEYEVAIDKRSIGQLLYERVCDYLDLLERDYFGLQYKEDLDVENVKFWLDLTKKITKQKKRGKMEFEFALKFYPPDPTQLTESLTRYLVCLQIRRDIISGKLPCSQATHAMLGSYAVQADIGDYDPVDHGTGIDYIRDMPFAPDQTEDLLHRIAALHRQHKGQTPEQAELHYLEYSKKIALYGIDLHRAKDSDYVDILLGVGATGISVYRDNLRINRFVWPKILKISYRRNKFLLRIRPAEFETYESWIAFRLPNNKMAKRIWKIAVEHHAFLRLRSADDARKRTGFPRFGSKYRYSGRTLYQTRLNASMADRPSKQFERTHSRQSLNSVLNNNRSRSQDNLNHRREPFFEHPRIDIHDLSFDSVREDRDRGRAEERSRVVLSRVNEDSMQEDSSFTQEDRTPLQSPLPQIESPKLITRQIIRQPVKAVEDDDLDDRLPTVPKDSPQEERRTLNRGSPRGDRRPVSNHAHLGGVATPLAAVTIRRRNSESEGSSRSSSRSRSSEGSLESEDRRQESKVEIAKPKGKPEVAPKPTVAPKPGKEKPPLAKKPEKPAPPEKSSKLSKKEKENDTKKEKEAKKEKESKKDVKKDTKKVKDSKKEKEAVREVFM
ncbi:unnamed protein product [Lymnaea stagnalis]|uniref:FERM domain-containing protein n=1 Tax=Lymnaea stagnalis TaxID=6523 RepID=A0AAV2IMT1_LYMST